MTKDPWTDPDPQPGDFDAFLNSIDPDDPRYVQSVPAGANAKVKIVVGVEGEDAARLERIAKRRGQDIEQVISELLRAADRQTA